jgi:hypothetical protein
MTGAWSVDAPEFGIDRPLAQPSPLGSGVK